MTRYFYPPNTAQIIPLVGSALLLECVDLQKMEGKFKIFESVEKAMDFQHSVSKKQMPKWHEENCDFCRMEQAGM